MSARVHTFHTATAPYGGVHALCSCGWWRWRPTRDSALIDGRAHQGAMNAVASNQPACPHCDRSLSDATGDWQCHACQMLWPHSYFESTA